MILTNIRKLNHVKIKKLQIDSLKKLFTEFRLSLFLKECGFIKKRGTSIEELISIFFFVLFEGNRSINKGLEKLSFLKYKTPINDLLKNPDSKWSKLLFCISRIFMNNTEHSQEDGKIIIDDTKKEKTGQKVDFSAWFFDHSNQNYYKGFQNIVMAYYNGKIAIPIEFKFKIGRRKLKPNTKQPEYSKNSATKKLIKEAKQSKNKIVLKMLKRVLRRAKNFKFVLWDSWFNNSDTIKFVFSRLVKKNIHLISMHKRCSRKYRYKNKIYDYKQLYRIAGKWKKNKINGIMYKSLIVEYLDTKSSKQISKRETLGKIKMCFFKYPNVKKYKILISTDLELNELEILKHYMARWSIEVMFKDIKQYFGYDQNKNSKYSSMVGDLTLRSILYIFFAQLKSKNNDKSIGQLVFEFCQELMEVSLSELIQQMFIQKMKEALDYAQEIGYRSIKKLQEDLDYFLLLFFKRDEIVDKIIEV